MNDRGPARRAGQPRKKSENVFKGSSIGFCLRWLWKFDGGFVNGNFADAAASMMFRQSRINL